MTVGKPEVRGVNGRMFTIQHYQGEHSGEYSMMEMVNGVPNGDAYLYDKHGLLMMRWKMVNGKEDGTLRVYDKGKLSRKTEWSYFSKYPNIMPWFEYTSDGCEKMILEDMETGHIIYRGEFNELLNRHGYGIVYDSENGEVRKSGLFCNGHFASYHQKFEMEDGHSVMIEYDRDDMQSQPQPLQHPVYVGGYAYNQNDCIFVRDGKGTFFDKTNGLYIGKCEYQNGVEINSEEERKANQSRMEFFVTKVNTIQQEIAELKNAINVISTTTQTLRANDTLTQQRTLSISSDVRKLQSALSLMDTSISDISSEMSLLEVSKTKLEMKVELGQGYEVIRGVEKIEIADWQLTTSKITKLIISNLPRLKTINIGFNNFVLVRNFELSNCPKVESLFVGSASFNSAKSSGEIKGNSGSCKIHDCSKLESIEIVDFAFWDYRELKIWGM